LRFAHPDRREISVFLARSIVIPVAAVVKRATPKFPVRLVDATTAATAVPVVVGGGGSVVVRGGEDVAFVTGIAVDAGKVVGSGVLGALAGASAAVEGAGTDDATSDRRCHTRPTMQPQPERFGSAPCGMLPDHVRRDPCRSASLKELELSTGLLVEW
jgi:hypothetical protein